MTEEILLLDDDSATLAFLEGVLAGAGYICLTVQDAKQALDVIRVRSQIVLVISDIYMPGLTGLEFVDQLNSLPLPWHPPAVLLMTAHPSVESAVGALRLGACDFLTKPVRPADLVQGVERAMERARRARANTGAIVPDVEALIRQVTAALRSSSRSADSPAAAAPAAKGASGLNGIHGTVEARLPKGRVSVLDAIDGLRKLRHHYDDHKLDDVAWDMLLELLRAEQKGHKLSVSALTVSLQGTPPTTSLRRLGELTTRGYVERVPDARDGRRDFLRLTSKARELLADYLTHGESCLVALRAAESQGSSSSGR
jgi:CheY-like chemotaxis protein/DNA-binding MarR family transcriptional regulator